MAQPERVVARALHAQSTLLDVKLVAGREVVVTDGVALEIVAERRLQDRQRCGFWPGRVCWRSADHVDGRQGGARAAHGLGSSVVVGRLALGWHAAAGGEDQDESGR